MRKLLVYLSNHHEDIFRLIIIIASVFILVSILPRQSHYKFEFDKNDNWQYDDLYSPFDFAVLKPRDLIEAEKKEILLDAPSYFIADTNLQTILLAEFEEQARETFFKNRNDSALLTTNQPTVNLLITSGRKILFDIYVNGVTEETAGNKISKPFYIIKGKLISKRNDGEIFTMHSASDFIDEKISGSTTEESVLREVLKKLIRPNVFYDEKATTLFMEERLGAISLSRGMAQKDELIISKSELVDDEKYAKLISLKKNFEKGKEDKMSSRVLFWGQLAIISIAVLMLMIFLRTLRKDVFADNRRIILIFMLMILIAFSFAKSLQQSAISYYLVPCCILPIVIRVFFDTRLALFTHVITILFLAMIAPGSYDFVFMQIIAGMITIFSFAHLRKRAQLFFSVSLIFVSYVVCYVALSLIHNGTFRDLNYINIGWLFGNALLTLFAYPLIYIIEKTFGLISDVSLMEMSDLNSPLLRDLSLKAPGTFQHSMQVANLAEAAIFKVGGNTLLVRAGALYHDIGKMDMPLYFIENQNTTVNPHDDLSFEESATIIISHVIRGIEKARKNKLPDLLIDFIRTHHGTTMVQYFYQSYLKNYPEKIADEDDFRYPGPLPFSKETAVLMMADSVEAASRSLQKHDAETLSTLVDTIIESQIKQQQFINCDITFKDIFSIKKIFKKMLMSIYHVRIEYPE
ncbi:MAG: HD family phosphohydrolase [Bacteroidia bacterium]